MMKLNRLASKAKQTIDKRGGMENFKGDMKELKEVAKGEGSLKEKAKAAGQALKEPGAKEEPAAEETAPSE
jgi:hypothetical protein